MKLALLVIDVQDGLFNVTPPPYKAEQVISNINALTKWAQEQSYPVVFIQHEEEELPFNSPEWQLPTQLHTDPSAFYVRKTTPDSFLHTQLAALLEKENVDRVVICGYASDFCVDTTTRRAAGLGFPVLLVADAHTTHDKAHALAANIRQHHNETLSSMSSFGVPIKLATTECILKNLNGAQQFFDIKL
ncbi:MULTISPECIES: cysteine hydrolase family protein [Vibrio]|uniref:Isochorismatase family protein n=2 Tax=Vibrio TaxID=662 RepID=A0A7X4LP25_9VIBR|nr:MULTISPECIES: cysteine hydrolase family protein [Vibrio]MBF9002519.1 cysteine hydrolase [Vibrio nitrifigilis]MZI95336.1 isochorismatase family protein [Vibrio eleionomae]